MRVCFAQAIIITSQEIYIFICQQNDTTYSTAINAPRLNNNSNNKRVIENKGRNLTNRGKNQENVCAHMIHTKLLWCLVQSCTHIIWSNST